MRKLSQIEAEWKAATPGPWKRVNRSICHVINRGDVSHYTELAQVTPAEEFPNRLAESCHGANAKAIANAPTDIRDLVAWVKKALPAIKKIGTHTIDTPPYYELRDELLKEIGEYEEWP